MAFKILIVEDDADVARGLTIRLRANGYETVLATDALAGVSLAVRERPDLMLLDLGLPGGDGFVVLERLQGLAPSLPVVVLTGRNPAVSRPRALEMGAHAFLQKPVDNEELLETIRQELNGAILDPAIDGKCARILLVDDDEETLRGLSIRLKACRFEPLQAADGFSAVAVAKREKPDLVLLDLALPGGDGFQVMDRLRALDPTLPVIILTARDSHNNREIALQKGARAFLQKPETNENVVMAIRVALAEPESVVHSR